MPLQDRLPGLRDHVLPVFRFGGAAAVLAGQQYAPDQLVAADVVKVHDHHVQTALADLLPGHVERELLVEDRIEGALEDGRFPLLHPLLAELQPHLHVGVALAVDVLRLEVARLDQVQRQDGVRRVVAERDEQFAALVLGRGLKRLPERRLAAEVHLAQRHEHLTDGVVPREAVVVEHVQVQHATL